MRIRIFLFATLICVNFIFPVHLNSANKSFKLRIYKNSYYVGLTDLLYHFEFQYAYDLYTQRIKLYYNDHVIVMKSGLSVFLIDGSLFKSNNSLTIIKGEVFIPYDAFIALIKGPFPNTRFHQKGNTVTYTLVPVSSKKRRKKYSSSQAGQGDKIRFIVLDAGHGGRDPGAIGRKIQEKTLTLQLVKHLGAILKKKLTGIQVVYTRTSDKYIKFATRTKIANKRLKKGSNGLFISIHVNASITKKISGYETYFLSQNPTNESARNTAALENNVIVLENSKGRKNNDLEYIEAMMLTTQIQKESALLAKSIQTGMSKYIKEFKSRGVKKADFIVLRGALMPAVLVEAGYITNKKELQCLKTAAYQRKIAKGVAQGVIKFINNYNKIIK